MSEKHRDTAASQSEPTGPQVLVVLIIVGMFVWMALSLVGVLTL